MRIQKKPQAAENAIDVEGTGAVTPVLLRLLNQFPGLAPGQEITFSAVPEDGGIGFFSTSGAVFLVNRRSITGHVRQVCQYPFTIVYRSAAQSQNQRLEMMAFLDTLGKWLERQSVTIRETAYQLEQYPELGSGNREIQSIARTNAPHLNAAYEDGMADWAFSGTLTYRNDYEES